MIKLIDVSKIYRAGDVETSALDKVSLEIEAGELVTVMGPSGCGKSTLLNILGMIDSPTSGRYEFDGEDVSKAGEQRLVQLRRRHLGFVFQSFNLIDELSVEENVELPLLHSGLSKTERRDRVRDMLELVGLNARAKHRPPQLSGGQQQRVAIARAVVNDPKLILADEPTGNLDSHNGAEIMGMLRLLHEQGGTIVMVTHSVSHAENAQRIVYMLDGRIVTAEQLEQAERTVVFA